MGFGDFDVICERVSVPLCSLVGPYGKQSSLGGTGVEATCYARSIELANTIIFQGASDFIHILSLVMASIMVIHVRSKFTAVGRKEITLFFYLFMVLTVVSLCLDSGVVPPGSNAYAYFVAAQSGITSATCWCLMINGFVGFQLYEDGTRLSVWLLRITSLAMFLVCGAVALCTFEGWAGLGPTKTVGLFVILYIVNALFLLVYVVCSILIVTGTLVDRWPLGDILFGVLFFVAGQVILYVFGEGICEKASHYLDGIFFATICNLLGVMMVYKYWDSITKEDLEFSVGNTQNNWEAKEPLMDEDGGGRRGTIYDPSNLNGSDYQTANRNSSYQMYYH